MKLSAAQIAEARRDRQSRVGWGSIARKFGISIEGLRRQVDPQYRQKRNVYMAGYMRANPHYRHRQKPSLPAFSSPLDEILAPFRHEPPPGISLTAWVFGDPAPGRSALDQKLQQVSP